MAPSGIPFVRAYLNSVGFYITWLYMIHIVVPYMKDKKVLYGTFFLRVYI